MILIPVVVDESGSLMAAEPIPKEAIMTIITPDGCQVFMTGDGHPEIDG